MNMDIKRIPMVLISYNIRIGHAFGNNIVIYNFD